MTGPIRASHGKQESFSRDFSQCQIAWICKESEDKDRISTGWFSTESLVTFRIHIVNH